MAQTELLEQLWRSGPGAEGVFDPLAIRSLPDPARRYLTHAIAPGTPLARAARLRMHGEIKLKSWLSFTAEEVIQWPRGLIWTATVKMHGVPIRGFDQFINGVGEMRWKLLGMIPMVNASGPDITRSAAARFAAETIWLPAVLASDEVSWTSMDVNCARARLTTTESCEINFQVDKDGRLLSTSMQRWGNPEGGEFHYAPFGAIIENESRFGGNMIPSELRVGWYCGTSRFESEGEFFRCTIDEAIFR